MRPLSRSSLLFLVPILALSSCAVESTDSEPAENEPVAAIQQAWHPEEHQWLTQNAARLADLNNPPPPLTLPWTASTTDWNATPLTQGNRHTDDPAGTALEAYFHASDPTADLFFGGTYQHLHFNIDYATATGMGWIGTQRKACQDARASIIEATYKARERMLAQNTQEALYFLGHALHIIQDSFATAHTSREAASSYRKLLDVNVWNLKYVPPSLTAHESVVDGDVGWPAGATHDAASLKPWGGAALNASKGYLLRASNILSNPNLSIDLTLNAFFDTATDGTDGFFGCGNLNAVPLPFITPKWGDTPTQYLATGWTSFMPFTLGVDTYLLGYKNGSGAVSFLKVASSAQGVTSVWDATWSTGWSSFVPFNLNGSTYSLGYKVTTGQVGIDRINTNLQGVTSTFQGTWTTGWTSFTTFAIGGIPFLFGYKAATGAASIDRLSDTGIQNVWTGSLPAGFTHITGFAGNAPFILAYNAASGVVNTYALQMTGVAPAQLWQSSWSPGWSMILPLALSTGSYFLEYHTTANLVALDKASSAGIGASEARRGTWSPGWSLGAAFPLGGIQHYLVFKQGTGQVAIDRVE